MLFATPRHREDERASVTITVAEPLVLNLSEGSKEQSQLVPGTLALWFLELFSLELIQKTGLGLGCSRDRSAYMPTD